MNLKQFKLTNDDEIICEVVETHDEADSLVIRKVLKIAVAEDFENNVRYYSFRPWVSFQSDHDELSVLNVGHIIGESLPSRTLAIHYAAAMQEVQRSQVNKKEFNLDKLMDKMKDMEEWEMEEFIEQQLREAAFERNKDAQFIADSAQPNVIHFKPPSDKLH